MFEIRDKKVFANKKQLNFGAFAIRKELARGKNGIVYLAHDEFLDRIVAIKIWTKLKTKDKRDKIQQGILEARKAHRAQSDHVVEVYYAGLTKDHFFVVMEYVEGMPLKDFLTKNAVPILTRIRFAQHILGTCSKLHEQGLDHGDLHTGNILVVEKPYRLHLLRGNTYEIVDYKIIDFGTSHFVGPEFSMSRHLRLIIELVDSLASPFKSREIYGYEYPLKTTYDNVIHWLTHYINELIGALFETVAQRLDVSVYDSDPHMVPAFSAQPQFFDNVLKVLKSVDLKKNGILKE